MFRSAWAAPSLFSVTVLVAGAHLRNRSGFDVDSTWRNGAIRVSVSSRTAAARESPVRGATVTLLPAGLRAQTDSAGIASFARLAAGDYDMEVSTVTIDRFGEEPISATVRVVDDSATAVSILVPTEPEMIARRCGDTLQDVMLGRVTRHGDVVPSAQVSVFDDGGAEMKFMTAFRATAEGRFTFCVTRKHSSGAFEIRVRSPDGARSTQAVRFSRATHIVAVNVALDEASP